MGENTSKHRELVPNGINIQNHQSSDNQGAILKWDIDYFCNFTLVKKNFQIAAKNLLIELCINT